MVDASSTEPNGKSPLYTNRELSWLSFNRRVLELAADPAVPLLERLKFCAIHESNLDEFFMVRVAGLTDQVAAGLHAVSPDGLTPAAQLEAITVEVREQTVLRENLLGNDLLPALAAAGVAIVNWGELDRASRAELTVAFEQRVFPILTPLAVDPGHPFPYISNLSLNLAVQVADERLGEVRFARVKVPDTAHRFMALDGGRYVPAEQVIAAHLDQLFPGMSIRGVWPFRVVRNADMTLNEDEADDLLAAVEMELRRRRFGRALRLEVAASMPDDVRELLVRELDLAEGDFYLRNGLLDATGFWQLVGLDRPDLLDPPFSGVTPTPLRDLDEVDIFARLRQRDVLVHHPYDSFSDTVVEFIRAASLDKSVLAIKLTLYRTGGDSPIVQSLIQAAERGKQVAVLVEVKARFDEQENIRWARRMEQAGIHVAYGLVGLKIHTKTALVIRDEADGLRRYCHVGTGNYNVKTAAIYEDLGLLTADPEIGDDLTQLFNFLTGYGREADYDNLLVAPLSLRTSMRRLIEQEMVARERGRIVLKMNSLVDTELIDLLYEASQAGASIDLIVRGICALRPGIPGISDNIRVRSIMGRYLEHSRIFYFGNGAGAGQPVYYIGSADLMPRNLDRRVEALLRAKHPAVIARLREVIEVNLAADTNAWELDADGTYRRLTGNTIETHQRLQELALARSAESRRRSARSWVPVQRNVAARRIEPDQ